MNRICLFILSLLIFSCKKAEEKSCFKSLGEADSLVYSFDSTNQFILSERIKYTLYQDSTNQIIVKGGKNVIPKVAVTISDSIIEIKNENRCNFLRDKEAKIEVEIHSKHYHKIKASPTDSMIFKDTIVDKRLDIELLNGGGFMDLPMDVHQLRLDVIGGVTHFKLSGEVKGFSQIFMKVNSYGDASELTAKYYSLYNNSTGDLSVNLEAAETIARVSGTGDIIYHGNPASLDIEKTGDGNCFPY